MKFYDTENYPAPDKFLDNVDEIIPSSLKYFLDLLIAKNKKCDTTEKKWKNLISTMSRCLISAVRPRSFISPIMLGLSSMMHKKHASRTLINSLFRIGLCASYEKTLRFESSIVHPQKCNYVGSIINFVFDNADHNTCTIDGRDTFHAMGGTKCVTPSSFVKSRDTY